MNELLNLAVEAHGGLARWNKLKTVKVAASITGAIWYLKSQGNALNKVVMTVDTKPSAWSRISLARISGRFSNQAAS